MPRKIPRRIQEIVGSICLKLIRKTITKILKIENPDKYAKTLNIINLPFALIIFRNFQIKMNPNKMLRLRIK